jgi:hypothetical protein
MSSSALSILVFGAYLVVVGAMLVVAPNVLLSLFGVPSTQEVWIRILGIVVFVFGLYFVQASREGVTAFFRWTVWGRSIVVVAFVVFVALGMAPRVLVLFAAIDAAGALWTALALRGGR